MTRRPPKTAPGGPATVSGVDVVMHCGVGHCGPASGSFTFAGAARKAGDTVVDALAGPTISAGKVTRQFDYGR